MSQSPPIIYTWTDEAPALATYSFLPVIRAFAGAAGVPVETRDISLAGRILAVFPERLTPEQHEPDGLGELGELVKTPEANVIKLPNISASVPQMKAAIAELQAQGLRPARLPRRAEDDEEREIKARYDKVKGSAVNPVLREGNSDRRAPKAVKEYARKNPHRMGKWDAGLEDPRLDDERRRLPPQREVGDRRAPTTVRIEHVASDGASRCCKDGIALQAGEIIDATFMSRKALVAFLREQIDDAKAPKGVLFSLHMKATMMKVSDPIIFGHACASSSPTSSRSTGDLERLGVDVNNGFGDLLEKIADLPDAERKPIEADIEAAYAAGPALAMVNSDKGITNLHVPSDIIIDASMPPMIRDSGGHVESDGRAPGLQGRDPRQQLRGRLPGRRRGLPATRRLRSLDDGERAERRADGPEGRGVRLARQDLRGAGATARCASSTRTVPC